MFLKLYLIIFMLLTCIFTTVSKTVDSLEIQLGAFSGEKYTRKICMVKSQWDKFTLDISGFKRDSITKIRFIPFVHENDTSCFYIDSVMLLGEKDTIMIEDFEQYKGIEGLNDSLDDRYWHCATAISSTACLTIDIKKEISKYLHLGIYSTENKYEQCNIELLFITWLSNKFKLNPQNWDNYHTLLISGKKVDNTNLLCNNVKKIKGTINIIRRTKNNITFLNTSNNLVAQLYLYTLDGKCLENTKINFINNKYTWHFQHMSQGVYIIKWITPSLGRNTQQVMFFSNLYYND